MVGTMTRQASSRCKVVYRTCVADHLYSCSKAKKSHCETKGTMTKTGQVKTSHKDAPETARLRHVTKPEGMGKRQQPLTLRIKCGHAPGQA
jgi:hypothetical protein